MSKMSHCTNFQFLSEKGPMGMGQFWVPESEVGHKWSNFQPFGFKFGLCTWFLGISTWKIKKLHIGHICATFGVLTLFGAQKLRCLITFDAVVHLIWNLAGFSLVMISKRWYGPKFLIFPLNRHMGMGQFWVPESAFGDKWSNFQPFRFKFGLYTWFLGISTWHTGKTNLGQFGPLLG